jgi:Xaa-Pro aminopeptidase
MPYYDEQEYKSRLQKVQHILEEKSLDFAVVYYDEFNLANAWYLTGWCPQFESGAVLIPRQGEPMILGGPESEPFAKQDSAVKATRNLPVFMVPDEEYPNATIISFDTLFAEIGSGKRIKKVGIAGAGVMPMSVFKQIDEAFNGVAMVDITEEYTRLRYIKSPWELTQIRKAFELAYLGYKGMARSVKPGMREYQIAAEGEYAARKAGANGFAFKAIVGSGVRSNAVVPTAGDRAMKSGEMVMVGLAPRFNGYAGVVGDTLPISGEYTVDQKECLKYLKDVFALTKEALIPGKTGKEIDAAGREYFEKHGLMKYLVCPFAHTIGINEAEAPFFGPNSSDILMPGMAVSIDISFFGHPKWNGARIESGYEITETGPKPFSPEMDARFTK